MNILCYSSQTDSIYEVELDKIKSLFEEDINKNLEEGLVIDLGSEFYMYCYNKENMINKYISHINNKINIINHEISYHRDKILSFENEQDELRNSITCFKNKFY